MSISYHYISIIQFDLNTAIWLADPPGQKFGYTW